MFARFSIRNQFNILVEVNLPAAYSFSDKIKADTVFLAKQHGNEEAFIILHQNNSPTMNLQYDLKLLNKFIKNSYHANSNYVEQLKSLKDEFLPYAEKYQLEKNVQAKEKEPKKTIFKI
jgi:hypothetical protein